MVMKGGGKVAQIKAYVDDEMKADIKQYCEERKISESTFVKLAAYELMKNKKGEK